LGTARRTPHEQNITQVDLFFSINIRHQLPGSL